MAKMNGLAFAAVGVLISTVSLLAHHAFTAEFDTKKPVKLRGTIAKIEMVNPHSWIHIDVKNEDGTVTNWMIEGGSPNALLRLGFTKNSLPQGTEIVVEGYQSKDHGNLGVGKNITFPDGKRMLLGGSANEPTEADKK